MIDRTIREEWYEAYRRQRRDRGKYLVVANYTIVTEALRRVMPPVRRIVHSRMNSGRPASTVEIYPPR